MQNYQNFYPTNNGYMQQQASPYQQRMDFLQSYQQSLQQPQQLNVLGKIVDGIESVKATEIPMDGNIYYFPKADGSEIYGKHWIVNEGRTRILTFKPITEVDYNDSSTEQEKSKFAPLESVTEVFNERFDKLENKISSLEASLTKTSTRSTKTSTTTKKERGTNE